MKRNHKSDETPKLERRIYPGSSVHVVRGRTLATPTGAGGTNGRRPAIKPSTLAAPRATAKQLRCEVCRRIDSTVRCEIVEPRSRSVRQSLVRAGVRDPRVVILACADCRAKPGKLQTVALAKLHKHLERGGIGGSRANR